MIIYQKNIYYLFNSSNLCNGAINTFEIARKWLRFSQVYIIGCHNVINYPGKWQQRLFLGEFVPDLYYFLISGVYVYVSNIDTRSVGRGDGRNDGADQSSVNTLSCYLLHIVPLVRDFGKISNRTKRIMPTLICDIRNFTPFSFTVSHSFQQVITQIKFLSTHLWLV